MAACADEGLRPAGIALGMSSITAAHRTRELPSPFDHPQVREVWYGVTRRLGHAATWGSGTVQAIALRDLNGDNNLDLIAVLSQLHGAGPCSSTDDEFPFVALIGNGRFEAIPESALNAVDHGISEDCVASHGTVQSVTRALVDRL